MIIVMLTLPVLAQDGPPPPDLSDGVIVMEGLNGPQGVHVDAGGALWVIDSGFGGDETITFINAQTFEEVEATFGQTSRVLRMIPGEEAEEIALLPSIAAGMDFIGGARLIEVDGTAYATAGAWHFSLGDDVTIDNYTALVSIADGDVEIVADLWQHEATNNPDATSNIESHPYGIALGPNGLLYVADAAANAVLAVDLATGETITIAAFEGLPGVFPNQWRDGEPITDPVPTAVVVEDDGTSEVVIDGLPFATALAFDADGGACVTINGIAIPNAGMVVYYEGLSDMVGSPVTTTQ